MPNPPPSATRLASTPGSGVGRQELPHVRVPADIDREDEILPGLTSRQVLILAAGGVTVWLAWQAAGGLVPPLAFLGAAAPVAAVVVALALGRRDGLSLDRYAAAAVRHARAPRRQVHAPDGVPPVPDVLDPALTATAARSPAPEPAGPVADGVTPGGVIDLGRDGLSVLAAVSTVNFALRTPREQEGLVGAFATWLNSLQGPVQIVVRTHRTDLTGVVMDLRDRAPGLPHPALERAALEHAGFLTDLAASRDLLHRQVLLVHHHPAHGTRRPRRESGWRRRRRTAPGPGTSEPRQGDAQRRLSGRNGDAAQLLAAADLTVTPLDGTTATGILSGACHPDRPGPRPGAARAAAAGDVERTGTSRYAVPDGGTEEAVTPEALEIGPRWLRVGTECVATLAVTGLPAEVRAGWLEPLLTYPGRVDVALHIEPIPPTVAADRLRKQRARLESTRRMTAARDRLPNPDVDAAAEDATDLAYALARGQTRLFTTGIYLTVHARTEHDLEDAVAGVRAVAESLLLRVEPVTWRALQGWITTLPLGLDAIRIRRALDTASLAAAFPFTSADLPAADPARPGDVTGVLYGTNASSTGLVLWDRWSRDNYNAVVLARAGSGKSYLAKLDLLRSLYQGVQILVIDPEAEYTRLADAVGGTVLRLGRPGVHLNPLALPTRTHTGDTGREAAETGLVGAAGPGRQALFVQTFCDLALGGLDPTERAVLDDAVRAAYAAAGITDDPRTWSRPAPVLADVAAALQRAAHREPAGEVRSAAGRLAMRLAPYVSGSYAGLFNGPTTGVHSHPGGTGGHLTVYSLRDLPDELKTLATLTTLDAIWQQVTDPNQRRPRLVVVDEAWLLMRDPAGAEFLFRMAKASRKHWAGLTLITQDAADLLATDLGQATVNNAATQILLRQAPQAIEQVAAAFGLSAGERQLLLSATRGHGLLLAGRGDRAAFHALASPAEDALITTDPNALAAGTDGREAA